MNTNWRLIVFINGIIVCVLALSMGIPLIVEVFANNSKFTSIFSSSILSSFVIGGLAVISCRDCNKSNLSRKDSYIMVSTIWCLSSIVSAFPFYIHEGERLSFVSALFEATSGITTTGASIYKSIEALPISINLWRFILHFLGGVGIMSVGILILPSLKLGGMQLFSLENSDKSKKFFSRTSQIAAYFIGIYLFFIVFFSMLLNLNGLGLFDSICHSISAISTGGFSTKNLGVSSFDSSKIELILSLAMIIGGLAILEIVKSIKYGIGTFLKNQQTICYLKLILFATSIPVLIQIIDLRVDWSLRGISEHIFQVVSAITTTGFDSSKSYFKPTLILMILGIIGGCAGSTSGGIKIFRIQILWLVLKNHIKRLTNNKDPITLKYQGSNIDESLIVSICSFMFLIVITYVISVLLICMLSDIDTSKAAYTVSSCLFNLGFDADFEQLDAITRSILIFDMILGRLEIIPLAILFSKHFWKS